MSMLIANNGPIFDLEVEINSKIIRVQVHADWYQEDEDWSKDRIDTAISRSSECRSLNYWLMLYELRLLSVDPNDEYVLVTKARTARLYERSATWLRGELKKSPCSIPCRDVKRKTLQLLKTEYDRLSKEEKARA